jgi:hypothetical protein
MTAPNVVVKTSTPRDRYTPTIRLTPYSTFPGLPIPGMPVNLVTPGMIRPIPGRVRFFDAGLGVVGVEPDYQIIHE